MIIKAISLHQPWAQYIADGRKTIETRDWYTAYRGDLLICSARKPALKGFLCGFGLAVVELYDCRLMRYSDEAGACCPWRKGAFSWLLSNTRPVRPPFSVRGRQGLFDVEIDL